MAKQIIWTKQALRKLHEIVDYLQEEASAHSVLNFHSEISRKLNLLSRFPEAGRHSRKKKDIRFVLVGKHHRMFYRIEDKKLIIIYFFDTRQSPGKSPF